MTIEALFSLTREISNPQEWSRGVELARHADFQEQRARADSDERVFRVVQGPRDPVCTVSLSEESEVWQCDCGSDEDPCRHVIAAVLNLRQGGQQRTTTRSAAPIAAQIVHAFQRQGGVLSFERHIRRGDVREVVGSSLRSFLAQSSQRGGVGSAIAATEHELRVDHIFLSKYSGVLDARTMQMLLPALSRVGVVELDDEPVQVSRELLAPRIVVLDEGEGFRVQQRLAAATSEVFRNGAALCDGVLSAIQLGDISPEDEALVSGAGMLIPRERGPELVGAIIPRLQEKLEVEVRTTRLPRAVKVSPRLVVDALADDKGVSLTVIPRIVYGDPPIAEVRGGKISYLAVDKVPLRNQVHELALAREVTTRLHLVLGEGKVFTGEQAVRLVPQLNGFEVRGGGDIMFTPQILAPSLTPRDDAFDMAFGSASGGRADANSVIAAWERGGNYVPLIGGGWGVVPREWLREHGEAVRAILSARMMDGGQSGRARCTAALLPDVEELCDSLAVPFPRYFATLRAGLSEPNALREAPLPDDLQVTLRHYQRQGVTWLSFLRDNQLGALLADDMGLGKTVQSICVLEPGSLVVAPTSVISSWCEQLRRFRPRLSVNVHHGPQRNLSSSADVVITTYALLRLDAEILTERTWRVVVLDEAQTIRNAESQVAQAAFRLRADFKVCLSGTPVENSLDDLWSQLHFLNPGLLGSRREFEVGLAAQVARGELRAAAKLRKRISPFILRRLKRDVAPELPPKTNVVLECELTAEERRVYDAVRTASCQAACDLLEQGEGNPFSILEALLRLRQACCHTALVPGQSAPTSSKVDTLIESLLTSRALGHRAIVFSQWTSLLDLVEPHLRTNEIPFSRIDGSTRDRARIVEEFQTPDGPPVMLLSLKAGGLGLTLTAADHVYILDPWWNPAVEEQASDRAHRIGQENPVLVHRIVAKDSIEERILELQSRKRALSASVVGEDAPVALTREDLVELLRGEGAL